MEVNVKGEGGVGGEERKFFLKFRKVIRECSDTTMRTVRGT